MNPGGDIFYTPAIEAFIPIWGDDGVPTVRSFISPKTLDPDAYCPISSVIQRLKDVASQDKAQAGAAKVLLNKMRLQETWCSNILVKISGKWKTHTFSYKRMIFRGILEGISALVEDDEVGDDGLLAPEDNIADAKSGVAVIINKTGEGLRTKYAVNIARKPIAVTQEQLDARVDLATRCVPADTVDIEEAFCNLFDMECFQDIVDPETALDIPILEDTNAPTQRKQRKRKQASVEEPDAEEDDDFGSEDEEDSNVGGYPDCVGDFGTPIDGLSCMSCKHAKDCKDISE